MPISRPKPSGGATRRAFTLVEVLVAAGLTGIVLAGVLTTSVQLMRSSVRVTQYAEMNAQVRRAFEQLGTDLKAARVLTWNGESDITITLPHSDGSTAQYTYAWSSATQTFYRVPGASSASTSGRIVLIRGIPARDAGAPGLTFARQNESGGTVATDQATKRIQVSLTLARTASGVRPSSSTVSATFTLRNKPVS